MPKAKPKVICLSEVFDYLNSKKDNSQVRAFLYAVLNELEENEEVTLKNGETFEKFIFIMDIDEDEEQDEDEEEEENEDEDEEEEEQEEED
jgi:ABC-type Zn2+ transport system substrate-binding protein/surface adhesin